jgi:glycogen(starch) synthase
MAFNHSLTRAALHATATGGYDVIHAHDWLVAHTAVTLTDHLGIPLVATIHATEAGRHQGWLPGDMNKCIHSVEWWLAHQAAKVLVCSSYMRWEVTRLLELSPSKVQVIPNGVDGSIWRAASRAVTAARSRFAGMGPLIGYAGRLVYEKGVQDLVGALPELRKRHLGLRLVIAGDGPHKAELQAQTRALRLQRAISFTGFLGAGELPAVLAATNAVVVPSIYEPFGMVALEAASAGAPLAVASTGGLAEIVEQGVTGVTFPAKDSSALAGAVSSLLVDDVSARRMAKQARSMIADRYAWKTIAASTAWAYDTAISCGLAAQAAVAAARLTGTGERTPIVVPDGNLFAAG